MDTIAMGTEGVTDIEETPPTSYPTLYFPRVQDETAPGVLFVKLLKVSVRVDRRTNFLFPECIVELPEWTSGDVLAGVILPHEFHITVYLEAIDVMEQGFSLDSGGLDSRGYGTPPPVNGPESVFLEEKMERCRAAPIEADLENPWHIRTDVSHDESIVIVLFNLDINNFE